MRWSTDRCFSNSLRFFTATSNVKMTGIPTPTLLPFSGCSWAKVCCCRVSAWVVNVVFSVTAVPSGFVPLTLSVYVADGSSRSPAVQPVLSFAMAPSTVPLTALPLLSLPA